RRFSPSGAGSILNAQSSILNQTPPPQSSLVPSRLGASISAFQFFSFAALVLIFLITRWIEVANPDWRLVSWAMAAEVVAITLLVVHQLGDRMTLKRFAFPILFFLVAIPWPTIVEHSVIQSLTRAIVATTIEFLHLFGTAAIKHGNVIETAGGFVDVDEACSGIRSFQAALMLALFFGEFHRFTTKRRCMLVGIALGLALVFNLLRTLVLSSVAADRGAEAIKQWHDPAGLAILLGCFTGIWIAATWLSHRSHTPTPNFNPLPPPSTADAPRPARGQGEVPRSASQHFSVSVFQRFRISSSMFRVGCLMFTLLIVGELAIYAWYTSAPRQATRSWAAAPPQKIRSVSTEIAPAARRILRFDESVSADWIDERENRWQLIYLRWNPGRVAVHLARNHTPEICLPASGRMLQDISDPMTVSVGGMALPFRCFTTAAPRPMFVFYSLWEDGAFTQSAATDHLSWRRRLEAVLQRRRNPGQRVLQIALTGPGTRAEAEQLLRTQLPSLIRLL
ncbi:MAG TPA: exosortase/archaeosortase family protein, partial [Candidatus Acidoferrum sp.]|nr:exosortase/archaeosortase family protein [Candidatus Acidoferrum sp.]